MTLLFSLDGHSQNYTWMPGEVLYKDGRIEKGVVDYKPWSKNPSVINFAKRRDSLFLIFSSGIIRLLPADISEVRIDGKDIYRGAYVTRYMNPLDVKNVTEYFDEPEKTEYIFLRQLSSGKSLSLYTYVESIKTHYFIIDSAGNLTTLRYVKYIEKTIKLIEDRIYKDQLTPYIINNTKASKTLSTTEWRDEEMIKLVKLINNSNETSYAEAEQKALQKSHGFFAGLMASVITYQITSNDVLIGNFEFNTVYRPLIYGGYRFSGGRGSTKLVFQLLAGWYSYSVKSEYNWNSSGIPVKENLAVKSNCLILGTELIYNLSGNAKTGFEIGVGVNSNLPTSVSSLRTTTEISAVTGRPVFREQLHLQNSPHISGYAVIQIRLIKKQFIRAVLEPMHKVDDFRITKPQQSLFALGYHFFLGKK